MLPAQPIEDRLSCIGFLLLPGYSALAFSSAIEPLRMANQLTRDRLYQWAIMSVDGQPVAGSHDRQVVPDMAFGDARTLDVLFVCGGMGVRQTCSQRILCRLRQLASQGVALGAICTGTYVLARAGVLRGYRCTTHWEHIPVLNERLEFPGTVLCSELFVIDRDRYTCAGGTAPLDMMLNLIQRQYGEGLAHNISEEFTHERIRTVSDVQRLPSRFFPNASQPKLVKAITVMEAHIEQPLRLEELARRTAVSRRQLERLFRDYLNCEPRHYYLELRLQRARQLLLQADMPVIDVALACGFSSPSHFSKCYHDFFDYPPSAERRRKQTLEDGKMSVHR